MPLLFDLGVMCFLLFISVVFAFAAWIFGFTNEDALWSYSPIPVRTILVVVSRASNSLSRICYSRLRHSSSYSS